jgi:hypothetical protein
MIGRLWPFLLNVKCCRGDLCPLSLIRLSMVKAKAILSTEPFVDPNPHVRTAAATLAGFSARNCVGALLAARMMGTQEQLPVLHADRFGDEEARGTPWEPRREKPENRPVRILGSGKGDEGFAGAFM